FMNMVNHWKMPQTFKNTLFFLILGVLSSWNLTEAPSAQKSNQLLTRNNGTLDNKAYIFLDSPSIILGNKASLSNPSIDKIIHYVPQEITTNSQLTGNCALNLYFNYTDLNYNVSNCLRSLKDKENLNLLTRRPDNTWIFPIGSSEFYQTNTHFHLQKGINTFFEQLQFAYNRIHAFSSSTPKALPPYIGTSKMFWFNGVTNSDSQTFRNNFLTSYSQCNLSNNASFSPAGLELCFGYHSSYPNFYFAQDPSIIYHELAHALVSVMMNFRNGTSHGTHKF